MAAQDDQDIELDSLTPMPQLRKVLQGAGATFSHWYVNTVSATLSHGSWLQHLGSLQPVGAFFQPVCCPSRSETLSGRYHHNLRDDGFRRDPDGGWCSGDEAVSTATLCPSLLVTRPRSSDADRCCQQVGEPHPCGCMNINNTDLPEALAFHATTYADYLRRASYTTVRPPLAPPSCRWMGLKRQQHDRGTSASS